MDDFSVSSLHESKNEWCARLLTILTPCIINGFNSIFNESWRLCSENDEEDKYLMTFQNLITQVPKWSNATVEEEVKRIIETSGCNYINDLITCVHVIHLKLLTSVRVGNQQKKIDLQIPKLNIFVHNCYTQCARKIYTNVYLFDKFSNSLQKQKNSRELEVIIQECILTVIRDSLPIENILKSYIEETVEEDVIEEILEEKIEKKEEPEEEKKQEEKKEVLTGGDSTSNEEEKENVFLKVVTEPEPDNAEDSENQIIKFNDTDSILTGQDEKEQVEAPKSVDFLEELSKKKEIENKLNMDDDDEDEERLVLGEDIPLAALDISSIGGTIDNKPDIVLDDLEILN
jgi:hypothetical protein